MGDIGREITTREFEPMPEDIPAPEIVPDSIPAAEPVPEPARRPEPVPA